MTVLQHPAREVARRIRAERDAADGWTRREVALRSDGVIIGRLGGPCNDWSVIQPWRMGADLLCALLQHAGYSRIE